MAKKKSRRPAPGGAVTPAVVDESNAVVREEDMMRDDIDDHLLSRDTITFDGDSESEGDEDLETEDLLQLPDSDEEDESEDDESGEEMRERGFEEIEDELREKDQAWGKKRSTYYNEEEEESDLSSAAEEELEEEEEREAMVLQKRLMSHLTDDHFDSQRFISDSKETTEKKSIVRTDFENMSKDDKLIFLHQNCPELPEMLEEFREKLSEAREPLYPLLQLGRQQGTFSHTGHDYIEAKYKLNLLYCLNIGFYLMLQSSDKTDVKNHPVIQRIVDLRKMFKTCAKTDFTLEKEIEHLLNEKQSDEEEDKQRKRKISSDNTKSEDNEEDLYEKTLKLSEEKKRKKKKKSKGIEVLSEDPTVMNEEDEEKRGITFKIMKNKGLTPHRKKEQRNPRVKHRKKYDKALKKRRSQVPDLRDHKGTYEGEKSGIKSNLTKSVKLR